MPGDRSQSRLFGILPTAALLVLANAAMAQGPAVSRYQISELDIAKELVVIGVNVNASQVHLPAQISARTASQKLEIVTVQPLKANQVRIELRCSKAAECLPFFASLDVEDANQTSADIQSRITSSTAPSHQTAEPIGGEPVIGRQLKVGSHAVLTIRDGHLNIHLQVLAIDSGAVGQQVRVSTLDRKKIFHATVTGEGTVAGGVE